MLNLVRWVSARTIKETFSPPKDYRYPFMAEEQGPEARSPSASRGRGFASLRPPRRAHGVVPLDQVTSISLGTARAEDPLRLVLVVATTP
jgi:hypothetical protein